MARAILLAATIAWGVAAVLTLALAAFGAERLEGALPPLSIDTDAHAPGQLDFLQYGAARAALNDVPAERIVTTWPLDRLLQWAGKA